jgi:hypothetical protein
MESILNSYLGLARAGVPVNKIILFLIVKKGTRFYERFESGFLR